MVNTEQILSLLSNSGSPLLEMVSEIVENYDFTQKEKFEELQSVDDVAVTTYGILLKPLFSSHTLAVQLMERYGDLVFTRHSDDCTTYNWVTDIKGHSIYILAGEVIDHNGTQVNIIK